MAPLPSVGDIMLLSQLAWKLGCAFTSGRSGAPSEFRAVENELASLTKSITLLSEALDRDDSILARADEKTKDGLDEIVECCRQTLENLNALVDQYQEIRKPEGNASLAVQRVWKPIFIRNYKKIWWTSEGGDIEALRNMLEMHVHSINLTLQALQSMSVSRLEHTIEPMAERVAALHGKVKGELDVKIAEIQKLMKNMTGTEGSPRAWSNSVDSSHTVPSDVSTKDHQPKRPDLLNAPPYHTRSNSDTHRYPPTRRKSSDPLSLDVPPSPSRASSVRGTDAAERPRYGLSSTDLPLRARSFNDRPPDYDGRGSSSGPAHSARPSIETVRSRGSMNSNTLPKLTPKLTLQGPMINSPVESLPPSISPVSTSYAPSQYTLETAQTSPSLLPMLPPAMMSHEHSPRHTPSHSHDSSSMPTIQFVPEPSHRAIATDLEQLMFERELARDSAVLCEVRGTFVEYTAPDEDNPGEWKMNEAASSCKISVITRMQKYSTGSRFVTSIWTVSDDRRIRLQHKLPEGADIIPYTIWGNTLKVVLRLNVDLKFCDVTPSARPHQVIKTSWVNYIFPDESGSILFQNVLMGKTLILSLPTKRTLRIHEGIAGAFAYQEQLCGLENIRLWQDDTGEVLAMIHYSAHFRDGYLAFEVGASTKKRIQFRDEGDRCVRIKGLEVEDGSSKIDRNKSKSRSKSKKEIKKITGVKIEFGSDDDKRLFLAKLKEFQES